jgi:hypothetical protein
MCLEVYEFSCRHGIGFTHHRFLADIGKPVPSTKRKKINRERGREVAIMVVLADQFSCRVIELILTTVNKHGLRHLFVFYGGEYMLLRITAP